MTFEELVSRIPENIATLRARLAASQTPLIDSLDDGQGRTGEFYVRQLGSLVNFENGRAEHIYNTHAANMRDRVVGQSDIRQAYAARLFFGFPPRGVTKVRDEQDGGDR